MTDNDQPEESSKQRDAIGGFFSTARHRPDSPRTAGSEAIHGREADDQTGARGDIDTGAQVADEESNAADDVPDADADADAADDMTAAEAAGQVAYGSGDVDGPSAPTGAGGSSG